ncbi:Septin-domain-containing protein [Tirmania nivea]|nr:Septin-domain-containing protein [Tirmania nivea]
MRPTASEGFMGGGRSRKSSTAAGTDAIVSASMSSGGLGASASSVEELHTAGAASMTYFLADEATVNAAAMTRSSESLGSAGAFGVHSLSSSGSTSSVEAKKTGTEGKSLVQIRGDSVADVGEAGDEQEQENEEDLCEEKESHDGSVHEVHQTFEAAVNQGGSSITSPRGKSRQVSAPNSPFLGILKSPRSCDDFSEAASQAVISGGEEEESLLGSPPPSSTASPPPRVREKRRISSTDTMVHPPQFIMPTIKMPSRRPFTARGKSVGRLKILVAGDSGIGKSSLIKAIAQSCEDIVHVDPAAVVIPVGSGVRATSITSSYYTLSSRAEGESTRGITEVHASTKPYPHWWSEHEDSKVLRRRKSSTAATETVLERNICFVDTPGYGSGTSFAECVEPVVRYVEMQMEKTAGILRMGDGDLLSLLSGAGTPQVDIVFYVILHRLKPVDVEYIRRLSPLTSVLPVIAKADSLTQQQIKALKVSVLSDLRAAGIRPFLFGKSYEDLMGGSGTCAPFAISSAVSSDQDNMDASVLMSPDYNPPLIETELEDLIAHVLEPENIAWLKHVAAKKFINWSGKSRSTETLSSASINSPQRSLSSSVVFSTSSSLMQNSPPTFTLARLSDHTQREERFAQARLARWATDLQRSLRSERERYERLAKGERAIWLTERLNECIKDGQLVPISSALIKGASNGQDVKRGQARASEEWGGFSRNDPLGILGSFRKLSRGTVYVGYGGGVLAFIAALWALRNYGMSLGEFSDWFGFRMG